MKVFAWMFFVVVLLGFADAETWRECNYTVAGQCEVTPVCIVQQARFNECRDVNDPLGFGRFCPVSGSWATVRAQCEDDLRVHVDCYEGPNCSGFDQHTDAPHNCETRALVFDCTPKPICSRDDLIAVLGECESENIRQNLTYFYPANITSVCEPDPNAIGSRTTGCTYIPVSSGVAIAFNLFTALIHGTLLAFAVFVWVNRGHHVMKASQFIFLLTLLAGFVVMLSSIYLRVGRHDDRKCASALISLDFGFTVVLASLLLKSYRVHAIFFSRMQATPVRLTNAMMMTALATALVFEAVICAVYLFVDQPRGEDVVFHRSVTGEIATQLKCTTRESIGQILMAATKCFYFILLLFYAFRIRNINPKFQESKAIFFAAYNMFFVAIIVYPLSISSGDANSAFIYAGVGMYLIVLGTVLPIFAPKIQFVWKNFSAESLRLKLDKNGNVEFESADSGTVTSQGSSMSTL